MGIFLRIKTLQHQICNHVLTSLCFSLIFLMCDFDERNMEILCVLTRFLPSYARCMLNLHNSTRQQRGTINSIITCVVHNLPSTLQKYKYFQPMENAHKILIHFSNSITSISAIFTYKTKALFFNTYTQELIHLPSLSFSFRSIDYWQTMSGPNIINRNIHLRKKIGVQSHSVHKESLPLYFTN